MSDRLIPYLIPILTDRVARLELRKNTSFKDLDPELYEVYRNALEANDFNKMADFLEKLDAKYANILYLKS